MGDDEEMLDDEDYYGEEALGEMEEDVEMGDARSGYMPADPQTGFLSTLGAKFRNAKGGLGQSLFQNCFQISLVECLGTALFVLLSTATIPSEHIFTIAIADGFSLAAMIATFGAISGGHYNPAVTVGVMLAGSLHPVLGLVYFLAQMLGAVIGSGLCRVMLSYPIDGTSGETQFQAMSGGAHFPEMGVSIAAAVICEVILTYYLVTTVIMTDVEPKTATTLAPMAIGFGHMLGILAGVHISGGSMNPARSFGPAIMISDSKPEVWVDHYVYWIGPLIGALWAGVQYRLFLAGPEKRIRLFGPGSMPVAAEVYEEPYDEYGEDVPLEGEEAYGDEDEDEDYPY